MDRTIPSEGAAERVVVSVAGDARYRDACALGLDRVEPAGTLSLTAWMICTCLRDLEGTRSRRWLKGSFIRRTSGEPRTARQGLSLDGAPMAARTAPVALPGPDDANRAVGQCIVRHAPPWDIQMR